MSELAELQTRFAAGLLDADETPAALFRGDAGLAARRFALYRGNLTAHWDRALGNACPVIRQMLGDDFFRAMARAFGRAHPHAEGDLNRFGAALPDFLAGFAPVADYPYLPDMARLEWALHVAHGAADAPAIDAPWLAALDVAGLDGIRLDLHPAVALMRSEWAIDALWLAHQPDGPPWPDPLARACHVAVCRPRWRAQVQPLSAGEHAALSAIARGLPLGAALETGLTAEPGFDPGQALPRWLLAGLLIAHPDHSHDKDITP
ncbi:DUF2063 domain-containing protein [Nitrogeniibacter mangrovi]|uniref:DUF2063 domain-containing protein n=1 Tax=Nitrogeniibacter mangrovi TaxID=2016596 RepID=A0A6C1B1K8_9RHOO|nr:DNA-binding domain-containing protein [Nitrogeniibacter mangrovi]QID17243.1 DUF2063 domain-containing protein [Nitrogeniibacter mangrovi]